VLVASDREVNETKLKNLLSLDSIALADEETIERVTGGPLGFSGPVGLNIPLYADRDVLCMEDFVVGGNQRDVHIVDVNLGDFSVRDFYDLKVACVGDGCPRCNGFHHATRGIEVGHIFKLGTKYSKSMNATFLDQEGKEKQMVMGCYGIGIGRTVAAAIEQKNDQFGMILPISIAPFEVEVLPVNTSHAESMEVANAIYKNLLAMDIDAVLDDRNERPGVKFKDCDLIGIPLRVAVGERGLKEGMVDIKLRTEKEPVRVGKDEAVGRILEYVAKSRSF
jgi:prolyl-tRNA synthetase